MANLNLSEFGEKLFVADADHTFIWDTQNAISKRVSRNSWLNSGTLTSDAPVTISQTWNGTGSTVFTALKVNATTPGTTSSSSSLLLDLQVGGVSKFYVSKTGAALIPEIGMDALHYFQIGSGLPLTIGTYHGVRIRRDSTSSQAALLITTPSTGTGDLFRCSTLDGGGVVNGNPFTIAFDGSLKIGGTDTILLRDSPSGNTLGLRNGINPQTFNVYGTSSSNNTVYERMFMRYTAASTLAFQIGTETVGATARPLEFLTAGTRKLVLTAIGNNTATIYSAANSTANILTLRNLSETAKFEFNLNASGNAGLYLGTNALISEVGNSYFNGGNVGIGTTNPGAPLHVQATAGNDIRETLFKGTISDAGNDAFHIFNGTSANGRFSPSFSASTFSSNVGSLIFTGQTNAANDNGTGPLVLFNARITSSETDPNNGTLSAVSTRPLFTWTNHTTSHMLMAANGNLGIGTTSPSSKLHVAAGDVEVDTIAKGVILKSPDGTRYRVTVANGGTLSVAAV